MLVNTQAKVGVFAIALGAYLPQFPQLVPEFQGQYEVFRRRIPDTNSSRFLTLYSLSLPVRNPRLIWLS